MATLRTLDGSSVSFQLTAGYAVRRPPPDWRRTGVMRSCRTEFVLGRSTPGMDQCAAPSLHGPVRRLVRCLWSRTADGTRGCPGSTCLSVAKLTVRPSTSRRCAKRSCRTVPKPFLNWRWSQLSTTNPVIVHTHLGDQELRHSDAPLCMRHRDTLKVSVGADDLPLAARAVARLQLPGPAGCKGLVFTLETFAKSAAVHPGRKHTANSQTGAGGAAGSPTGVERTSEPAAKRTCTAGGAPNVDTPAVGSAHAPVTTGSGNPAQAKVRPCCTQTCVLRRWRVEAISVAPVQGPADAHRSMPDFTNKAAGVRMAMMAHADSLARKGKEDGAQPSATTCAHRMLHCSAASWHGLCAHAM
jgi:hypothetical protein